MTSIELVNVSIEFPVFSIQAKSFKKAFVRLATGGVLQPKNQRFAIIKALNNINLKLHEGDRVGLIGHNGSGKSTLLRVIAGIYEPTHGYCQIKNGAVTSILDILSGINPDSTGYENIILRGIIQGMSFKTIREKTESIAEFTGLGNYLAIPVHSYSAGMLTRLAFAITTSFASEILLFDEVIETGDITFKALAAQKIKNITTKVNIFMLATHNEQNLKAYCNKLLWLDKGEVKFFGSLEEGLHLYQTNNFKTANHPSAVLEGEQIEGC